MVDKTFLEAIGWRGIRQRKAMLEELIPAAVLRLKHLGRGVNVLDIAAGHGRYRARRAGRMHRAAGDACGCRTIRTSTSPPAASRSPSASSRPAFSFHKADAFDAEALANLDPAPDLAIVSGLYELFPDNDADQPIARRAGARHVAAAHCSSTPTSPGIPQLEMIARSLTSHRGGDAWVMRRRTQAEMDQLVETAGFRKIDQRIDEFGIFTVSVAERM